MSEPKDIELAFNLRQGAVIQLTGIVMEREGTRLNDLCQRHKVDKFM